MAASELSLAFAATGGLRMVRKPYPLVGHRSLSRSGSRVLPLFAAREAGFDVVDGW